MASENDIKFHYDGELELFKFMLDSDLVYSCGNWSDAEDLEQAQLHKFRQHTKLARFDSSSRSVLDVGCGFGAFLKHVAAHYPNIENAVGLTVSTDQFEYCNAGICNEVVEVVPLDVFEYFKKSEQKFDHAVSIGAFEHFASARLVRSGAHMALYQRFFKQLSRRVTIGASLQTIINNKTITELGVADRSGAIAALKFILREIFPNSYLPTLAEIIAAASPYFRIDKVHTSFLDYQTTLAHWQQRLQAHADKVCPEQFARFDRYLTVCREQFAKEAIGLVQIGLTPIVH